jgi:hypothetical protein
LEKEGKKPDLVVWSKERGYYASQLTYGSNLGAPAIKLEDVAGWKTSQAMGANKHFNVRYEELKDEFNKMLEEVHWNDMVYSSDYSFIPVIGETYHLYERANGKKFLSIIDPSSWNIKHLGSFKLDSDKKWNKI